MINLKQHDAVWLSPKSHPEIDRTFVYFKSYLAPLFSVASFVKTETTQFAFFPVQRSTFNAQRPACPDTDGFAIRLVETPVYSNNISLARLRNHQAFAHGFYRVIPKPLRKLLGPHLLAPMHRSAMCAYQSADKITAVGQSYLDLAKSYLATNISTSSSQERRKKMKNWTGAYWFLWESTI